MLLSMKNHPLDQLVPKAAKIFAANLERFPFSPQTPQEARTIKKMDDLFWQAGSEYKLLLFVPNGKKLNQSNVLKTYQRTLDSFAKTTERADTLRVAAIGMAYASTLWVDFDMCIRHRLSRPNKKQFGKIFDKTEKNLLQEIDMAEPDFNDTEGWNAKNFALMAFSEAQNTVLNPMPEAILGRSLEKTLGKNAL
jgi:hypothetical protein